MLRKESFYKSSFWLWVRETDSVGGSFTLYKLTLVMHTSSTSIVSIAHLRFLHYTAFKITTALRLARGIHTCHPQFSRHIHFTICMYLSIAVPLNQTCKCSKRPLDKSGDNMIKVQNVKCALRELGVGTFINMCMEMGYIYTDIFF